MGQGFPCGHGLGREEFGSESPYLQCLAFSSEQVIRIELQERNSNQHSTLF